MYEGTGKSKAIERMIVYDDVFWLAILSQNREVKYVLSYYMDLLSPYLAYPVNGEMARGT